MGGTIYRRRSRLPLGHDGRVAGTKFERGTAVTRDAGGAYRAFIGEEWNCPVVPHGGLVTAAVVRAMTDALDDPEQTLRSVTTVFAAQVH